MKNLIFMAMFLAIPVLVSGQAEDNPARQPGLQVYRAKTVHGTVVVNLPDKMYPGETISGSVIAEPLAANNPKKDKQNLDALIKSQVVLFGMKYLVGDQLFQFKVPMTMDPAGTVLQVETAKGVEDSFHLEILEGTRPDIGVKSPAFPGYLRSGEFQAIAGPFDGQRSNSAIMLNDLELPVVAESPGNIVTMLPENLAGRQILTIREGGEKFEREVNVLNLELLADAVTLRRGESASLHVNVTGLEGINQPVTVQIENLTPMNISMSGGNRQEWVIQPSEVEAGGVFHNDLQITALTSGGFTVTALLSEPVSVLPGEGADHFLEGEPDSRQEPIEYCGKTWTDVKDIGKQEGPMRDKQDKSGVPKKGKVRARCESCSKKTDLTITTYPLYYYQKQQKTTYTCSMLKGHTGECHGTGKVTVEEKRIGPVGYEEEARCPKGHLVWKK
jgi:hypothetical protein